jgi:hypothetical protein
MSDIETALPLLPPIEAPNSDFIDIAPIGHSTNCPLESEAQIPEFVEAPLVEPVTKLWRKQVPTFTSSANVTDVAAMVGLKYDELSPENQQVVQDLIDEEAAQADSRRKTEINKPGDVAHYTPVFTQVIISTPLAGQTPETVTDFFNQVAERFVDQSVPHTGEKTE